MSELPAEVSESEIPLTGFATSVPGLESHLSGKLKEVSREPMPYDVFLSHAGADKPAVERLAKKLREAGVEPFLDKWHLIPGEPWQEALEEALDQSRTCAVFICRVWLACRKLLGAKGCGTRYNRENSPDCPSL